DAVRRVHPIRPQGQKGRATPVPRFRQRRPHHGDRGAPGRRHPPAVRRRRGQRARGRGVQRRDADPESL
ncbi:MAG: hypothetical protein AVDCRST_MAG04-754, partial [uncultured Acetobacteraceae bacterium]